MFTPDVKAGFTNITLVSVGGTNALRERRFLLPLPCDMRKIGPPP
jgi:hypothetical protein